MLSTNLLRRLVCSGLLSVLPLAAGEARILQTNSGGDNVHIIDPVKNQVVGVIKGIELSHGIALSPDGARYYVTNESNSTLDVVDAKTLKVTKSIKTSGHPHNMAMSKDGKRVYISIIERPGGVDVVDTATLENVKTIKTKGTIHNTYVTPDGKYVVSGGGNGIVEVINQATEEIAFEVPLGKGLRPMAFTTKPDGSTDKILVNITAWHGFVVIDFDQRKEVQRVKAPEAKFGAVALIGGTPSHGLAVSPDGKSVWCASEITESVYGFSLPDFKLIGGVHTGSFPNWLTFAPNGVLYVADSKEDKTTAVDVKQMKILAQIPVGSAPKRVVTAVFP